MLNTLKTLCLLNGTSGREDAVRDYIVEQIKDKADVQIDPLGNVLAFVKGRQPAKNKVMLSAHMDEVGFLITGIDDDGFLRFDAVGGIDSKVVVGRSVTVGEEALPGVVGLKAIHLCEGDEEKTVPKLSKCRIDIGAASKEEAQQHVCVGDAAYFVSDFKELGPDKIKAKAIDDRYGCAVLLDLIEQGVEYDAVFAFLVQEEIGLRGAGAAAFTVQPDYAVVLEATTAADVAGVPAADKVCVQGGGAVVSFMDRTTLYDRKLFSDAFALAKEKGIPVQTKTTVAGGNDAGAIHKSNGGVKTLCVSLPCRYIHSATSVADKRDMKACRAMAEALLNAYAAC